MWMALRLPVHTSRVRFPHSEEPILSHIVTIKTEVRDPAAVAAACRRLALPEPVQGTAKLFRARPPACSSTCPTGSTRSSSTRPPAGPLRQLRRQLGRRAAARPLPAGVRRREGPDRGPQEELRDHRAVPGRRLDPGRDRGGRCGMKKIIRDHRRPQGRDEGRDQGLLRRRVPRGQPVRRAGPRPAVGEQLTAEFYQAQQAEPGAPAVAVTSASPSPTRGDTRCSTPASRPATSR